MGFTVFFKFSKLNQIRKKKENTKKLETKNLYLFKKNLATHRNSIKSWWKYIKMIKSRKFCIKKLQNDGSFPALLKIISLRNVFVNQLPNMPINYVNKLVLDKKHNLVLLEKCSKSKTKVIGGFCYRFFKKKDLIELVFLAVSTLEQGKGLGKELMKELKEIAIRLKIKSIITCADNNAISFFKKQGFSKGVVFPYSLWVGYVKEYEEITLMECILPMNLKYLEISVLSIHFFQTLFKKLKKCRFLKLSKKEFLRQTHHNCIIKIKKIESNIIFFNFSTLICENQSKRLFEISAIDFLNKMKISVIIKPFLEPVDTNITGAKDYFKITPIPMDLRTIEEKFRSKKFFLNPKIFENNILFIIQNCQNYNGKFHSISFYSSEIENFIKYFDRSI